MRISAKDLGNIGEQCAAELLLSSGYTVSVLPINSPTYDLHAVRDGASFYISVKVSRDKQHVRLGSRNAVNRLTVGNFVFAFLPKLGTELVTLDAGTYTLLILPAEVAREDSLRVHDDYWAAKTEGKSYSVMVKGYGRHHREIWPKWLSYADAWHLLP